MSKSKRISESFFVFKNSLIFTPSLLGFRRFDFDTQNPRAGFFIVSFFSLRSKDMTSDTKPTLTESDMRQIMIHSASMTLSNLSETEVIQFNMCLLTNQNPTRKPFWSKVKPLYTEMNGDIPKMHSETKLAVNRVLSSMIDDIYNKPVDGGVA